jgi:tetratricopeptide (TPR) repeat protein
MGFALVAGSVGAGDRDPLPRPTAPPSVPRRGVVQPNDAQPQRLPDVRSTQPPPATAVVLPSPLLARRNQQAMQLGARGAVYAAEEEFLQTLQLVAQLRDERDNCQAHSKALAAGLTAFAEADHFTAAAANPTAQKNVQALVAGHKTPILKSLDQQQEIPALYALQRYYEFAQSQLLSAMGNEPGVADALFGLARVYTVQAAGGDEKGVVAKAIALLQVAIAIDPDNHFVANELGVLLARCGRLEQAQQVFLQGLAAHEEPELWQNLAEVHRRLGQFDLAQRAEQRCRSLRERQSQLLDEARVPQVTWVDPTTFAQTPGHGFVTDPTPSQTDNNKMPLADAARTEKKASGLEFLKSFFRFGRPPAESRQASLTRTPDKR